MGEIYSWKFIYLKKKRAEDGKKERTIIVFEAELNRWVNKTA